MKKKNIAIVIVVILILIGFFVWKQNNQNNQSLSLNNYKSPALNTLPPANINSAADLNSSLKTINQTSISSSNQDSNQLSLLSSKF